ncbi:MAG: hypothetical protein WBE80_06925 [Methylocella sp.]
MDLPPEHDAIRGGGHLSAGSQSEEYIQCVKRFEACVERLGHIAEELDGLAQSTTSAIAAIEAQGDRIDCLQADNSAMLDELLNGS